MYMLVPRSMFFEFIPVEESGKEQPTVCLLSTVPTPLNLKLGLGFKNIGSK